MDIMIIPSYNLYCLSFLCNLNYTVLLSWFYKTLWLEKYHIHNELCLIYARHSAFSWIIMIFLCSQIAPGLWFSIFCVVSPFVTSSFHNVCWLNSVSYYFFYKLDSGRQFNRPWKKTKLSTWNWEYQRKSMVSVHPGHKSHQQWHVFLHLASQTVKVMYH